MRAAIIIKIKKIFKFFSIYDEGTTLKWVGKSFQFRILMQLKIFSSLRFSF